MFDEKRGKVYNFEKNIYFIPSAETMYTGNVPTPVIGTANYVV